MQKTKSITLSEYTISAVEKRIDHSEYDTADDVILAGLALLDQERKKVETLRKAIEEGELSGPSVAFDPDAFKSRMKKKYKSSNA